MQERLTSAQALSASRRYRLGFLLLALVVAVLIYLKWSGAYLKYQAAAASNSMTEWLYLAGGDLYGNSRSFSRRPISEISGGPLFWGSWRAGL